MIAGETVWLQDYEGRILKVDMERRTLKIKSNGDFLLSRHQLQFSILGVPGSEFKPKQECVAAGGSQSYWTLPVAVVFFVLPICAIRRSIYLRSPRGQIKGPVPRVQISVLKLIAIGRSRYCSCWVQKCSAWLIYTDWHFRFGWQEASRYLCRALFCPPVTCNLPQDRITLTVILNRFIGRGEL